MTPDPHRVACVLNDLLWSLVIARVVGVRDAVELAYRLVELLPYPIHISAGSSARN